MISPELGQQLADLGGFALFLLVVIVAAVGLFRKWWVPGWVYQGLLDDWKVMRDQGDRNAKALEAMADRERERQRRGGT